MSFPAPNNRNDELREPETSPTSQPPGVPRVAFLGFCERSVEVTKGHQVFWHTNVIGLSKTKVSFVFPLNLRGQKIALAIYEPKVGGQFLLRFRPSQKRNQFEVKVGLTGATEIASEGTSLLTKELAQGTAIPGWVFMVTTVDAEVIAVEPDTYKVILVDSGAECYLDTINLLHAPVPPFTPEDLAAIRSDPLALKSARIAISCKICGDALRAYTGIERSDKFEADGWIWHEVLGDRFRCKCGAQDFTLIPLRTGFHGVLRRNITPAANFAGDVVRLYESTALEEYCRKFLELIDSFVHEGEIHDFLLSHPVFFSMFLPVKLLSKRPVLSKYVVDFAVLNARKELVLIEIERPGSKLVKKDGGISADLQHALDQVRSWLQVFDDHRGAALDGLGLKLEDVAKVKGVVIAGRTPKDETAARLLRAAEWGGIDVFTFDDLLKSATEILRRIATA